MQKKNTVWAAAVSKEPTITTLRVVNLLWIIAEIFIKIDGTIRISYIYMKLKQIGIFKDTYKVYLIV